MRSKESVYNELNVSHICRGIKYDVEQVSTLVYQLESVPLLHS